MPNSGELWLKQADGTWTKDTHGYVRAGVGWSKIQKIYIKNSMGLWPPRYERDAIAPGKPTITQMSLDTSARLTVGVKAPGDTDMAKIIMTWSLTGYPTNTTTNPTVIAATANQTVTHVFPGQATGRVIYWSMWAVDSSGNISLPTLYKYTTPRVYTPPTTVTKSGYFSATDSGSWNANSNYWRTDNNYVYQGGYDWHGLWFYGTRITGALAAARTVTKMTITITRANTVHGVSGGANVYLTHHSLAAQPSGSPSAYDGPSPGTYLGTLNRGETKTFTVPSSWYASFASKAYKGFGLYYGPTSFVVPQYMYALGAGTSSGKVYIQWTE